MYQLIFVSISGCFYKSFNIVMIFIRNQLFIGSVFENFCLFLHWYWSLVKSFYIQCFYIGNELWGYRSWIIFHFFIEFFFILFTFWIVGTKLRFLFRILSTSVISFLLLKIITMPAGSDWNPIEFLIVFHTLIVDLHSLTKLVIVIKTIFSCWFLSQRSCLHFLLLW